MFLTLFFLHSSIKFNLSANQFNPSRGLHLLDVSPAVSVGWHAGSFNYLTSLAPPRNPLQFPSGSYFFALLDVSILGQGPSFIFWMCCRRGLP